MYRSFDKKSIEISWKKYSTRSRQELSCRSLDLILVKLESSNKPSTTLTLGSRWTSIYKSTSGLANDPGPYTCGITQWFSNNSIWYTSYRMLVLSKRTIGNFVQYSELELFGY
jgi:hypothetical protein